MATAGDVIRYGESFMGRPYVFGAAGPNTFDCSGLMQYVFHHFGVDLPRTSEQQARTGSAVSKSDIQPGDLVFSDWGDGPNSHVGLAVDKTHLLNAPHTGAVVRVDNLTSSYIGHVTAVRRVSAISGGGDLSGLLGPAGAVVSDGGANSIIGPLVQPLKDLASAAGKMGQVADLATKAFLPSNFVRISAGIIGAVLILFGILVLSREVRT